MVASADFNPTRKRAVATQQGQEPPKVCAIDFGTSNSAVAVPTQTGVQLARVEGQRTLLPTAIFYDAEPHEVASDSASTLFGREAIETYIAGHDGRLMRSMKSILGSSLMDSQTDIGGGKARSYADVVGDFLRHLKHSAQAQFECTFEHVVLGRPVFFVDDDAKRDATAQSTLEAIAKKIGFQSVEFQFEPLAAAFDLEQDLLASKSGEKLVLICDFGGGTCDFSVARLGASAGKNHVSGSKNILAHHGIHVAGTDFDRQVSLASIMPSLGHRSTTTSGRDMPSGIFYDLASWHLINTCYGQQRLTQMKQLRSDFTDTAVHQRLMRVLSERLGHTLAGMAEDTKVAVATAGDAAPPTTVDLSCIENGLQTLFDMTAMQRALSADVERIGLAAQQAVRSAGLKTAQIELLYFTGGSSKLTLLSSHIRAQFSNAKSVFGDSFASVAKGLGVIAQARSLG